MADVSDPASAIVALSLCLPHHQPSALVESQPSTYSWEFFTTLDYEWSVIRGHRPYRWTIWIYSFTRLTTLAVVILVIVGLDGMTPHNCQVTVTLQLVIGYLSLAAAELLIILRILAIWSTRRVVFGGVIGLWVTNMAFLIQSCVKTRSIWVPTERACVVPDMKNLELALIVTFIVDVILLFTVLLGLFRMHREGGGMFGLSQLLWKQGMIWLILAIVSQLPPGVLIVLNLNYSLDIIFQPPSRIVMTIAATLSYRALTDYVSGSTDIGSDSSKNDSRPVPKITRAPFTPNTFDRLEVPSITIKPMHHCSYVGTGGPRYDKQNEQVVDQKLGE
ncbi:hypothetical protein BJV74DRAFT_990521 [Russula compacta]|nr:hypothetical protein BJV74DRAFT_990521 [Russula compacta]